MLLNHLLTVLVGLVLGILSTNSSNLGDASADIAGEIGAMYLLTFGGAWVVKKINKDANHKMTHFILLGIFGVINLIRIMAKSGQ